MLASFRLAARYVAHHKFKTVILVTCICLTAMLPLAAQLLIHRLQLELTDRAQATPLVMGAKGSRLDLVLHALYFRSQPLESLTYGQVLSVQASGLADVMPLHAAFTARGAPIVGCTLDYFGLRDLRLASGDGLTLLGDCVLGSELAATWQLQPGDRLLSDPQGVFDLAGVYPLRMKVAGVLQPSYTVDDQAVFVDLKTAWVIQGLWHGHQDVTNVREADDRDQQLILRRQGGDVVASPAIVQYNEITAENIAQFHFHGDPQDFPVTAAIVRPHDEKSGTLLAGRYLGRAATAQILAPTVVIGELLQTVFRVQRFLNALAVLVASAMVLVLGLVVALSLRLRQREMETMFKIGCSRGMILRLQLAELTIVLVASSIVTALLAVGVSYTAEPLVRTWIL